MEPREETQPWPSGHVPTPAWTKQINGAAYTVKRIADDVFGIWRETEELGTFALRRDSSDELQPVYGADLSLEARTVVPEFLASYIEPFEGAARRD
jgi:hypothetical protein